MLPLALIIAVLVAALLILSLAIRAAERDIARLTRERDYLATLVVETETTVREAIGLVNAVEFEQHRRECVGMN